MSDPSYQTNARPFRPCAFIPDGWTRREAIPESSEGYYPAVTVEFRPMTNLERETLAAKMRANGISEEGVRKSEKTVCETIAGKLVSWDVTTPDGADVPISPTNVARLEPHLIAVLLETISGNRRNPEVADAEKN